MIRLLIFTQKVDRNDPVLGFFHRWLEEFAKHTEKIIVICLYEGSHSLPRNVQVLSLGKEKGGKFKTLRYIVRFYHYTFSKRREYDAVFTHMNPEYVVLGGPLWKLWNKQVALWYNHKKGGIRARIAAFFADIIFYTSPDAFMSRFKKAERIGAGIDTTLFRHDDRITRIPHSILSLGRISPVKHIETIIEALTLLDKKGIDFTASIYGDPTDADGAYYGRMRSLAKELERKGKITFVPGLPNTQVPDIMNRFELFVNMTPSGSFDKTILEASSCEMLVISCNRSFQNIISPHLLVTGPHSTNLAEKIKHVLSLSEEEKDQMGKIIRKNTVEHHDLRVVMPKVMGYLKNI